MELPQEARNAMRIDEQPTMYSDEECITRPLATYLSLLLGAFAWILWSGAAFALPQPNPTLTELPPNQWVHVHSYSGFWVQNHGSAVYDSDAGRVVFFGSDTHGANFNNQVTYFDPFYMTWHSDGPASSTSTYRADAEGSPIAGTDDDPHPWAMHTYDALVLDPVWRRLYVYSAPHHNYISVPGVDSKRSPTWIYDLGSGAWSILDHPSGISIDGFAQCSTYDSNRDTIMAYSGFAGSSDGLYEMGPLRDRWVKVQDGRPGGHCTMDYDSVNNVAVVFGMGAAETVALHEANGSRRVVTPGGARLPSGEVYDAAFNPDSGVFLVLADEAAGTETYLYDYAENTSSINGTYHHLPNAGLALALGMNHGLVYDPHHKVFLLFMKSGGTQVYAFKPQLTEPNAPLISALNIPEVIADDANAAFSVTAADPDGDDNALVYAWTIESGFGTFSAADAASTLFTPDDVALATRFAVSVTVTDTSGDSTSAALPLTVFEPQNPLLLLDDFNDGDLAGWAVVDEGTHNGPSNWRILGGGLVESSNILHVGSAPKDPGTYLEWMNGTAWTDYRLRVDLRSTDNDRLGAYFRMQDTDNWYRFDMGEQAQEWRLVKMSKGNAELLWSKNAGYVTGSAYRLEISVQGPLIEVYVNDELAVLTNDSDVSSGTVALYSFGQSASVFDDVIVEELDTATAINTTPTATLQVPASLTDDATATFMATASDPDGDDALLAYQWHIDPVAGSFSAATAASTDYTPADVGTATDYTVSVTVTDADGGITTASTTLTVEDSAAAAMLLSEDFSTNGLSGWTVVDEGSRNGPSDWRVTDGVAVESSNILHVGKAPHDPGTYLHWDAGSAWTDYRLSLDLRSTDNDRLGVYFRMQSADNWYRFDMGEQAQVWRLVKMVDGVAEVLWSRDAGYVPGTTNNIAVTVNGSTIDVQINGTPAISLTDTDLPSGTVALYSFGQTGSYFDNLSVEALGISDGSTVH